LRTFFRWAHRSGYVKADPATNLDLLELGQGQRRAGRWLTKQDALQLLEACLSDGDDRGIRDHALIAVALLGGLRRAELAGLRWRDVDLPQRV
jgi:integrase/recombinase XerC